MTDLLNEQSQLASRSAFWICKEHPKFYQIAEIKNMVIFKMCDS